VVAAIATGIAALATEQRFVRRIDFLSRAPEASVPADANVTAPGKRDNCTINDTALSQLIITYTGEMWIMAISLFTCGCCLCFLVTRYQRDEHNYDLIETDNMRDAAHGDASQLPLEAKTEEPEGAADLASSIMLQINNLQPVYTGGVESNAEDDDYATDDGQGTAMEPVPPAVPPRPSVLGKLKQAVWPPRALPPPETRPRYDEV
jgi:hypothetical protein